MNTIKLDKLSKTINNDIVLSDVSMEMTSGKIYGIVGKNGSGKSMLFRALADLIQLDQGSIWVDGELVHNGLPRVMNVGLVIENVNLHMDLNAMDNLLYLAKIRGKIGKKEIEKTLERVGLDIQNKKKIKTYSLGMRQKLIIAQAIMEDPDILLLDEPTNALDAETVKHLYHILKEEAKKGKIVLIASHNQEDVEVLCDEVFYMKNGVLSQIEEKEYA